ncbi:XRE family transcriptional regulator [Salmonella enterica subsp. enterica]|nr:XRE family transcriptional regulator [Salmonella enterica subsp. enterica]
MEIENSPENIKILRKKIGITQKECAEMFGMTARSWRRKEEPTGTVSGTTLSPVEFKYLLLLAGEDPDYVLCRRENVSGKS